jgi:hypothetical protein
LIFPIFSKEDFAGVASGRHYRVNKAFEAVLDSALGDQVRADGACGVDLWSALANICWHGPEGEAVGSVAINSSRRVLTRIALNSGSHFEVLIDQFNRFSEC